MRPGAAGRRRARRGRKGVDDLAASLEAAAGYYEVLHDLKGSDAPEASLSESLPPGTAGLKGVSLKQHTSGTACDRPRYAIMDQRPHMVALAQRQGIKAAYEPHMTPMDCPWPPELHEEVYGWLLGYSVGRLRRQGTSTAAPNPTTP
jgi:hypothetical protein